MKSLTAENVEIYTENAESMASAIKRVNKKYLEVDEQASKFRLQINL
jgi:hypothetical protein